MADAFLFGVIDVCTMEDSKDLMLVGIGKGEIGVGNALTFVNFGSDGHETTVAAIKELRRINENQWEACAKAQDQVLAIRIERDETFPYKKSTVGYTMEATQRQIRDMYIAAIGDSYVTKKDLDIEDGELSLMSVTDLSEIARLFIWYHENHKKDETPEDIENNKKKLERVRLEIARKIPDLSCVYCVFSKVTGEPNLFTKAGKEQEKIFCMPPNIRLITEAYHELIEEEMPKERFELKRIDNGEDKKGILNFLGNAFYINGAQGVEINTDKTAVAAGTIVTPPDLSAIEESKRPLMNPQTVRWLLLLGQQNGLESDEDKLLSNLFYNLLGREIMNTKFMIPVKLEEGAEGLPKPEKANKMALAIQPGRNKRPAVRLYTDLFHLKLAYPKTNFILQNIETVIKDFDCVINVTPGSMGSIYFDESSFEDLKKHVGAN